MNTADTTYAIVNIVNIYSVAICEVLQPPENGNISYNESLIRNEGYPMGTLASFTCDHPYTLNVPNMSTCQASRNWDHPTLTCDQGKECILKSFYYLYCYSKVNVYNQENQCLHLKEISGYCFIFLCFRS